MLRWWKFCRTPVLEKASKSVWELILDGNGLGKEISETVERVYHRLSGLDLPVLPPQSETAGVARAEVNRGEESETFKEAETPKSSARKRSFGDMSMQDGAETVANGCSDQPTVAIDNGVASGTNQS